MYITVGENTYELSTKLGTVKKIEDAFGIPMNQLFGKIGEATSTELIKMIALAAKGDAPTIKKQIEEEWDYLDLFERVQELILRTMFAGTPEQNEKKLAKFPAGEDQKNEIRALLGMPIPTPPEDGTGNKS
jgi:hypothetical protein